MSSSAVVYELAWRSSPVRQANYYSPPMAFGPLWRGSFSIRLLEVFWCPLTRSLLPRTRSLLASIGVLDA